MIAPWEREERLQMPRINLFNENTCSSRKYSPSQRKEFLFLLFNRKFTKNRQTESRRRKKTVHDSKKNDRGQMKAERQRGKREKEQLRRNKRILWKNYRWRKFHELAWQTVTRARTEAEMAHCVISLWRDIYDSRLEGIRRRVCRWLHL